MKLSAQNQRIVPAGDATGGGSEIFEQPSKCKMWIVTENRLVKNNTLLATYRFYLHVTNVLLRNQIVTKKKVKNRMHSETSC